MGKTLGDLRSFGKTAHQAVIHVSAGLIFLCTLVSLSDIVFRYLVGGSIMWAQQIAEWCMPAMTFIGAGAVLLDRGHINIDMVFQIFKKTAAKSIDLFNHVCTLAFSIVVCSAATIYLLYLIRIQNTRLLGTILVPYWEVVLSTVTIGSYVLLIYSVYMVTKIASTLKQETKPSHLTPKVVTPSGDDKQGSK
ncbi:MAG: TRAP transporter small permease [Dehalococcoidia bacterium]|nr:TRAP transporter small permease [Dehalococcoidia bacterium]